jgi:DNA-binding NtrC family response regulator
MDTTPTTTPMVVIESARPGAREAMAGSLQALGFEVTTCAGPRGLHAGGCPLVETTDCPQVARAAAVVHDLDLDDPDDREVLLSLRARYPGLPVVLETPTATARRHADILEDCVVVPPYSPDHLAEVVRDAIGA